MRIVAEWLNEWLKALWNITETNAQHAGEKKRLVEIGHYRFCLIFSVIWCWTKRSLTPSITTAYFIDWIFCYASIICYGNDMLFLNLWYDRAPQISLKFCISYSHHNYTATTNGHYVSFSYMSHCFRNCF